MMILLCIAAAAVLFCFAFRKTIAARLNPPDRGGVKGETRIVLAGDDFPAIAKTVMEGLGGRDNVVSADNCITRLRLEVRDCTLVDEKKIKSAGAAGIIRPSRTAVQIIIGTQVQHVAEEFKKLM